VSLTFDDARLTQPDVGIPLLDRFGVKGTFYVTPRNMTDRINAWHAAVANGHDIGNHTLTHPCSGNYPWSRDNALEDYTLERMERELLDANAEIERLLGVAPRTFAYPCGQTCVGRGEGRRSYVPLVAKHFRVGRGAFNDIPNDPTFCDLACVASVDLDGATSDDMRSLVEKTTTSGGWLVLFSHEIGNGGFQITSAETLEKICAFRTEAKNRIWIDTVRAVGEYVAGARDVS